MCQQDRYKMLIRRYQAEDNESVKALHYAGVRQIDPDADHPDNPFIDSDLDDIEGVYINNRGDFIVGIENDTIVAMGAIMKASATRGEIRRVRVRQDCQRQGLGRKIMERLIEVAGELGYKELYLDTLVDNPPAQRLFEKCGFAEKDRIKMGPYDLVLYGMKLDEGGK
jgi:ribosomal protein S18 acetylase RimI-like enzyme